MGEVVMPYRYEAEKDWLFTKDGTLQFIRIRQRAVDMLRKSGAFRMEEAISGECGSSWEMLACVDRMVEIGEIREVTGKDTIGQHRVFVVAGSLL